MTVFRNCGVTVEKWGNLSDQTNHLRITESYARLNSLGVTEGGNLGDWFAAPTQQTLLKVPRGGSKHIPVWFTETMSRVIRQELREHIFLMTMNNSSNR